MSNSQISTFDFKSNPVRVEIIKNQPCFCLTDVCSALDISNANSSRFKFNEDGVHKMYSVDKLDRRNELTFINEPNLYRIIFRSNKAEAVDFQNWVFEEVLPKIRKTGQYSQAQQLALPEPEKKFSFELTQDNIHDLVWLLFSHGQMNWLLGRLIKPLQALGSSFSPAVVGNHNEYQRHYRDCLPIMRRFIEPLKQANPKEWQHLLNRLNDN